MIHDKEWYVLYDLTKTLGVLGLLDDSPNSHYFDMLGFPNELDSTQAFLSSLIRYYEKQKNMA